MRLYCTMMPGSPARRARAIIVAIIAILGAAGGYRYWYHHRGPPDPIPEHPLFRGITYERIVRTAPRPMAIHLARIELASAKPFVTPPDPSGGRDTLARKTSSFLEEFDLQLAVNGGFFYPFHSNGPFDYYPSEGDPVDLVGIATSGARAYGDPDPEAVALAFFPDRAVLTTTTGSAAIAISGAPQLVSNGGPLRQLLTLRNPNDPEPRTALAIDRDGRRLLIVVVDGRQPSYSEGITLGELADLIVELGFFAAVNLDGGGSSVLVSEENGRANVLSSPIHGRHPPGRERPVANHLGFFAKPL